MLSGAAANVADWETVAKGFGFGFLISGVIIGFIGCALLVKQRFFPPVKKPGEGI